MNAKCQNLDSLPSRMKDLPKDERGFVIPWFVAWINGKPEFRAMDTNKLVRAIKEKLCWVCGEKLGVNMCFVAGPMCGINRTSSEPPSHLDCARWSAANCPFLSNPRMVRREDDLINNASSVENAAGIALSRNPGVTMLWITRNYEIFNDGTGRPLIHMGEPDVVEWYTCGRRSTHSEVMNSIESGLSNLVAVANTQPGALFFLETAYKNFQKWIPA